MDVIPIEGSELRVIRDPKLALGEAALVGNAVAALVRRQPDLVKVIGGRKHPRFELLQIVGRMFGVTARSKETRHLEFDGVEGWECDAEAYHIPTGSVVSTAQALCLNDEPNWNSRSKYRYDGDKRVYDGEEIVPTFQRRSMSQTRACSKALRLAIGWVLGMAGYEATAAEEMTGNEHGENGDGPKPSPQRNGDSSPDSLVTEKMVKRLWGLAYSTVEPKDAAITHVSAIINRYKYERTDQIKRKDYDAICAEIQGQQKNGA